LAPSAQRFSQKAMINACIKRTTTIPFLLTYPLLPKRNIVWPTVVTCHLAATHLQGRGCRMLS
ncbi:MAG: hypothetical protein AAF745_02525, partial [Planctomycetota bacterium]